jgi:hypothetical protein
MGVKVFYEASGDFLAIVGALYGVVLGLVVFDAMSNFQDAVTTVKDEAKSLIAVYTLSEQFPDGDGKPIRRRCKEYVDEVIDNEWHLMEEGELSNKAKQSMLDLLNTIKKTNSLTENQKLLFPTMLQESISIWENSRERADQSSYGIPTVEWIMLLTGGLVTIIITFFFTPDYHPVQLLMTGMVALVISMNLYLVLLFGTPFSGGLQVDDEPFVIVRQYINEHL